MMVEPTPTLGRLVRIVGNKARGRDGNDVAVGMVTGIGAKMPGEGWTVDVVCWPGGSTGLAIVDCPVFRTEELAREHAGKSRTAAYYPDERVERASVELISPGR